MHKEIFKMFEKMSIGELIELIHLVKDGQIYYSTEKYEDFVCRFPHVFEYKLSQIPEIRWKDYNGEKDIVVKVDDEYLKIFLIETINEEKIEHVYIIKSLEEFNERELDDFVKNREIMESCIFFKKYFRDDNIETIKRYDGLIIVRFKKTNQLLDVFKGDEINRYASDNNINCKFLI
jgi:hypothetical protein